jgi:hypothetical protein
LELLVHRRRWGEEEVRGMVKGGAITLVPCEKGVVGGRHSIELEVTPSYTWTPKPDKDRRNEPRFRFSGGRSWVL